jgi:hypothetical protein
MRLDASVRPTKRRLGGLEGIYSVPEDFEEIDKQLDKEVEKLMFGEDEE